MKRHNNEKASVIVLYCQDKWVEKRNEIDIVNKKLFFEKVLKIISNVIIILDIKLTTSNHTLWINPKNNYKFDFRLHFDFKGYVWERGKIMIRAMEILKEHLENSFKGFVFSCMWAGERFEVTRLKFECVT